MNYQNVRSMKKKTHIKKRSLNPVFNESFIFDLPSKEGSLEEIQLEVVMCDWDRITKNEASIIRYCNIKYKYYWIMQVHTFLLRNEI